MTESSMWDKDKAFAPDGPLKEKFPAGSKIVLYGAWIQQEDFETSLGTAPMVHLEVADLLSPNAKVTVSMIGDLMADRIRDPESKKTKIGKGDLPAVVETKLVPTDQPQEAFVLRFLDPWNDETAEKYGVPF